jgi:hypothetical protein
MQAALQASRNAKQSSAGSGGGGGGAQLKSFINILSAPPTEEERRELISLLQPAKASAKVAPSIVGNLVYNSVLDCFIDKEGNCFASNINETTFDPIPNMSKVIGKLRPGVNREKAQLSNFVEAKERSRKRKNRRNRTRKN